MKYTTAGFLLFFFTAVIILFPGCMNKKIDPVLKYDRQQEREEIGNKEWWVSDEVITTSLSPFIDFYKQNPFLYSLLSWEICVSKYVKRLSDIHWLYIHQYIDVQTYLAVKEIIELVKQDPQADVPDTYSFLIPKAKYFYTLEDMKQPVSWTIKALCRAFLSSEELFDTIKAHYHEACMTSEGKLSTALFTQTDSDDYEMKITIRLSENDTYSSPESLFRDFASIFNYRHFFPAGDHIKVVRDTHHSISVSLTKQDFNRKDYLTFHLIYEKALDELSSGLIAAENKVAFLSHFTENLPPGIVMRIVLSRNDTGFPVIDKITLIEEEELLNNSYIDSAVVQTDTFTMRPVVTFHLTQAGADLFYKITQEHENEMLAIVMNDIIVFSARISEPISSGSVQIRGQGIGIEEAKEIVNYLNSK